MEQLTLWNNPLFKIENPIRLIELFAGIGSQAKALENLGANFEHWKVCEFDKYAIASYNAVHGTNFKPSDITQLKGKDLEIVDTEHFTYLLTYSFPCQDLSNAGNQKGMVKGSGTRSGLLWEVERLLRETENLPQVLLMENVPQVHAQKNMHDFKEWILFLDGLGYSNYWEDLNAKNYGIPQNRNRCFMVSILGDYDYKFPNPIPLKLRLKDMLEDEVEEKYYLSEEVIKNIKLSETCSQTVNVERERERSGERSDREDEPQRIDTVGISYANTTEPRDVGSTICCDVAKHLAKHQHINGVIEYGMDKPKGS